jgi:uncharacterized protein
MAERRPDRTRGKRHDIFWDWCARGELRLQQCGSCERLNWPVRVKCEFCGHGEFAWAAMSGRGTVASWCSFEQDYYAGLLPRPYDCILVELDEGVLFMSNPKGFGWQDISPGMPVKLSFIDAEDSSGPFKLPVFEPTPPP